MIQVHSSKVSDDPQRNFAVAVCDGCEVACLPSRLPGRVGFSALGRAREIAVSHGWVTRLVAVPRKRGNIEREDLLCPACQATGEGV